MNVCPVCGRPGSAAETRCLHDGATLVQLDAAPEGRPTDLLGQVVDGRYRVEGVVGRGGMGTVYAARHVVVGRPVALKVLRTSLEYREEALARFVREAQAANAVKSRHILRADDFGQLPGGSLYVVMELLEGRSLGTALRERLLSRDELLRVFVQLADGLGSAHDAGVVHRDLKPDNVFLVDDPLERPSVRILDFGVAKVMGSDAGLTSTGVILGTPHYMAPEQARGQAVDHRADIYALGVVMYQAFTGRLPFVADSAVGVLTAHAVDEPARPALSGVDAALESVILRCMRKNPADRFGSMADLGGALRSLGGQVPAGLPPAGSSPAGLPPAQLPRQAFGPPSLGPESSPGMTTAAAAPVSRGLYVALGAAIAVVGVVAALLVGGPGGLLRGPRTTEPPASAPAAAPPAPGPPALVASAPEAPAPSGSAAPSASASSASPAPGPPTPSALGSASPTPTASGRPLPTTRPPPAPTRPPRGEIRSPFD